MTELLYLPQSEEELEDHLTAWRERHDADRFNFTGGWVCVTYTNDQGESAADVYHREDGYFDRYSDIPPNSHVEPPLKGLSFSEQMLLVALGRLHFADPNRGMVEIAEQFEFI